MSAVKAGSSLQSLVVTPERIPDFLIPSHSPFRLLSPNSSGRTRLLSDHDDSPAETSSGLGSRVSGRAAVTAESGDIDLTTRAAMSLSHVEKVTTPYGFGAVLAASPCTRRRESLFHRKKRCPVPKSLVCQHQDPDQRECLDSSPAPGPRSGRGTSLISLRPMKALCRQVIKDLKRPTAALNTRRTEPR